MQYSIRLPVNIVLGNNDQRPSHESEGLGRGSRPAPAGRDGRCCVLPFSKWHVAGRRPASNGESREASSTDLFPSFTSSFFPSHFQDWKLETLFSYTQNYSLTHTFFFLLWNGNCCQKRSLSLSPLCKAFIYLAAPGLNCNTWVL